MFRSIFENWKLQDWKRTPGPVLKIFRYFLFENGVYTKIDKLVVNEDFPEYPIEDIQSWLAKGKRFNSRFNPVKISHQYQSENFTISLNSMLRWIPKSHLVLSNFLLIV